MLKHYFKITFRSLIKHKLFSLINITGLSIAMSASLLILFYVQYEFSFDKFWGNSGNIYRITCNRYQNGELTAKSAKALKNMAIVLKEELPEVKGSAEIFRDIVAVYTPENQIQDIDMFVADSSFQSVFNLNYIEKKSDNPLTGLYSSVISESAALRLFGTAKALGKWYIVNQIWKFEVTGIYKDLPQNSHIHFDLLLTAQTYKYYLSNWNFESDAFELKDPDGYKKREPVLNWDWGYDGVYSYLVLNPKSDPVQVVAKINELAKKYTKNIEQSNGKVEFFLQPLSDIHLKSHLDYEILSNGDMKYIIALIIITIIILAIAWINFISLSMARSLDRAKEIGVRKICGASRLQIIYQYFLEYSAINIISVFLALTIAVFSLPLFGQLLGKTVRFADINHFSLWITLISLFVAGILISGFYPALVQSSYTSLSLFKPKHKLSPAGFNLRKVLVTGQFAASIVLITGIFTFYSQIQYMRRQELGINIERTLVTYTPMSLMVNPQQTRNRVEAYKSRIESLAGIELITVSSAVPGKEISWQRQDIKRPDDLPNTKKTYAQVFVDHDFIDAYKLKLLAGNKFADNGRFESDEIILNEAALHQAGINDLNQAVNSFILVGDKKFKIIGVVKDYHQESLKREIKPIVFFYGYNWYCSIGYFSIKIKSADITVAIKNVESIWRETFPADRFEYFFLDDFFDRQYKGDQQFGKIFALFTLLAIFIAGMGLYGLASFSTLQRTKEIGIRKVNGAYSYTILLLLSKDFAKLVIIAFIIACPVSYYILKNWLQNFPYRMVLSWWIFALAGLLALSVAIGTIFIQAYKASTQNPVNALRNE